MNHRGFVGIILIVIVVMAVAVTGGYFAFNKLAPSPSESTPTPDSQPISSPAPTSTPVFTPIPKSNAPSQPPKNISPAHNAFGFSLIRSLNGEEGNKNVFISPSSIALALSMVYNGANAVTKNAMQQTLQLQNLDITTVNQESLGLMNLLQNADPKIDLSIANSVWAKKGVSLKEGFLKTVADYYNAEISTLDFQNPSAVDTINSWVDKNTKGKIPTIINSIPAEMVMYLINAVYFKGSWTIEFDKKLTEDRSFTLGGGSIKKHPLMKLKDKLPYLETGDFQSVRLSYGQNERLSMFVFLPKDINKFMKNLDRNSWDQWMTQYQTIEGTILLPRFKMEYEKELKTMLTKLGMGVAFTNSADFSGIGSGLNISQVKHKTYVDVNEEGTEAAAVTSVGIGITSVGPQEKKTFYMEVNKPFFFAIADSQTQEILFMGIVHNP